MARESSSKNLKFSSKNSWQKMQPFVTSIKIIIELNIQLKRSQATFGANVMGYGFIQFCQTLLFAKLLFSKMIF